MEQILDTIIGAPVATFIFAITLVTSVQAILDPSLKARFLLHPWNFVREKKYSTIITSGLIHANWLHLIMNMAVFYLFAFDLEMRMEMVQKISMEDFEGVFPVIVGHAKFFLLYVICLVMSDLTTIVRFKDIPSYSSLGASGAISGVVMSTILFVPSLRIWAIPGWLFGIGYILYSYWAARNREDNIGHEAHMWGAIAGLVFTFILFPSLAQRWLNIIQELF